MTRKSQYQTKQYMDLLEYFKTSDGGHKTAGEINEFFKEKGVAIGTTTIYRQLDKMVNDGIVKKYNLDSTSAACYEYIGNHDQHTETTCFHCKCEKCGRLIHLKCDELVKIGSHLMQDHKFKLDFSRTIFYGLCPECQKDK